jgi:hypothetical protein
MVGGIVHLKAPSAIVEQFMVNCKRTSSLVQ